MLGPRSVLGVGMGIPQGVGITEGQVYQRVRHRTWDTHPLMLTPSGGQNNTYSWQVGGMHPTGMLSGFNYNYKGDAAVLLQ